MIRCTVRRACTLIRTTVCAHSICAIARNRRRLMYEIVHVEQRAVAVIVTTVCKKPRKRLTVIVGDLSVKVAFLRPAQTSLV